MSAKRSKKSRSINKIQTHWNRDFTVYSFKISIQYELLNVIEHQIFLIQRLEWFIRIGHQTSDRHDGQLGQKGWRSGTISAYQTKDQSSAIGKNNWVNGFGKFKAK